MPSSDQVFFIVSATLPEVLTRVTGSRHRTSTWMWLWHYFMESIPNSHCFPFLSPISRTPIMWPHLMYLAGHAEQGCGWEKEHVCLHTVAILVLSASRLGWAVLHFFLSLIGCTWTPKSSLETQGWGQRWAETAALRAAPTHGRGVLVERHEREAGSKGEWIKKWDVFIFSHWRDYLSLGAFCWFSSWSSATETQHLCNSLLSCTVGKVMPLRRFFEIYR